MYSNTRYCLSIIIIVFQLEASGILYMMLHFIFKLLIKFFFDYVLKISNSSNRRMNCIVCELIKYNRILSTAMGIVYCLNSIDPTVCVYIFDFFPTVFYIFFLG